jgi:vacuolar-type H+-ATPase subunit H
MASEGAAPGGATGSIEALKRVRATENEWEAKVTEARRAAEETVRRAREEAETAARAAQADAEAERAARVQTARTEADAEAARILKDGERAAQAAARGDGKDPADRADEILRALLAGFGTE